MTCEKCPYENEFKAINDKIRDLQKDNNTTNKNHTDLALKTEKQLTELDVKTENITKMLERLTNTVEQMAAKPAKRMEDFIRSVISIVVGAILMYFLKGGNLN